MTHPAASTMSAEPTPHGGFGLREARDPGTAAILIGGHSHTEAFAQALEDAPVPGAAAMRPFPRVAMGDATEAAKAEYWDEFATLSAGRVAAVVWSGSEHLTDFLFASEPPFHVLRDGAVRENSVLVPGSMLWDLWHPVFFRQLTDVIAQLAATVSAVFVIGTPPPKSDAFVRAWLRKGRDGYFGPTLEAAGLDADTVPLTLEADRIAMWGIVSDMQRIAAEQSGAHFVPVPASCMDDDGLLRPELAWDDVTHANGAYGALFWPSIMARLAEMGIAA